ncbi:hypothetical protein DEO72_LG1g1139 [Vigna unguiculata]|uniref:Uncharacterized protein n=1 Tax=Vigna unguiculata TaxID=3917 RepID=A0A4D6KUX8_VIGUN|nr:hypothetical protein DEO72_LG1g1139 [Vigna unguiculata]
MAVMEKLKMFVVQEPVVAASCLIAGFGILKSPNLNSPPFANNFMSETPLVATKQPPQPALSDVVAGMSGKK